MARSVVKVAIFLLIVHALYRFVPVYFHYQQFKDAIRETALFSRDRTEVQIADRIMELAAKYHIPLERESVQVWRENERIFVTAPYVESIEWLPTYRRPWEFDVREDVLIAATPATPGSIR